MSKRGRDSDDDDVEPAAKRVTRAASQAVAAAAALVTPAAVLRQSVAGQSFASLFRLVPGRGRREDPRKEWIGEAGVKILRDIHLRRRIAFFLCTGTSEAHLIRQGLPWALQSERLDSISAEQAHAMVASKSLALAALGVPYYFNDRTALALKSTDWVIQAALAVNEPVARFFHAWSQCRVRGSSVIDLFVTSMVTVPREQRVPGLCILHRLYPNNESSTAAVTAAPVRGDVRVLKCRSTAAAFAVHHGDLGVLQWLLANRDEGYSYNLIRGSENSPCSKGAIWDALCIRILRHYYRGRPSIVRCPYITDFWDNPPLYITDARTRSALDPEVAALAAAEGVQWPLPQFDQADGVAAGAARVLDVDRNA